MMTRSESIEKLAAALCAVQAEVHNTVKSERNDFTSSSYAPLDQILNEVRPLLAQHSLSIVQFPASEGDKVGLTTMVLHSSGQYIAETILMGLPEEKKKSAAQVVGSIITYLRRYSLQGVLNQSAEKDTDGNLSTPSKPKETAKYSARASIENEYGREDEKTIVGFSADIMKRLANAGGDLKKLAPEKYKAFREEVAALPEQTDDAVMPILMRMESDAAAQALELY